MIQNLLRNLGGVECYGTLSLCLFLFIFACVLVWACLQRRSHLDRMSRIPLDSEEQNHGEKPHEWNGGSVKCLECARPRAKEESEYERADEFVVSPCMRTSPRPGTGAHRHTKL